MKKSFTRVIAALLSVLMLLSGTSVMSFAADNEQMENIGKHSAIGSARFQTTSCQTFMSLFQLSLKCLVSRATLKVFTAFPSL